MKEQKDQAFAERVIQVRTRLRNRRIGYMITGSIIKAISFGFIWALFDWRLSVLVAAYVFGSEIAKTKPEL